MKFKPFMALLAATCILSLGIMTFSCKEKQASAPLQQTSIDTSEAWCNHVLHLAKTYESNLIAQYKLSTSKPVETKVGVEYMASYQKQIDGKKLDTTSVIYLSDGALAFYLAYSIKHKKGGIGLALAKYDTTTFNDLGLKDPELQGEQPQKIGRYTLVVGTKPAQDPKSRKARYLDPFAAGLFNSQKATIPDSAYDNWHELWP